MRAASLLAGLLSAAAAPACVVQECTTAEGRDGICLETPVRYSGDRFTKVLSAEYEPGADVRVDGIYGDITVREGNAAEVSARFVPFAWAGQDDRAYAEGTIENEAYMELEPLEGGLLVRSSRAQGDLPLVGMDLEVFLPAEFAGTLVVRNRGAGTWNPGNVAIDFTGEATAVEVRAPSLSDCAIVGGPALFYTYARCGGSIDAFNLADDIDIESSGAFGDVRVELAAITDFAEGGRVKSAGGAIELVLPTDASFSLQAQAAAPEVVDLGDVPAHCAVATSGESAKSVTCGAGGPLYVLESGAGVALTL